MVLMMSIVVMETTSCLQDVRIWMAMVTQLDDVKEHMNSHQDIFDDDEWI